MIYLLQVSTCWVIMYAIYAIFLQRETYFSVNRYYLLGALSTGLLIPLIGTLLPANETSSELYSVMYAATYIPEVKAADTGYTFSWLHLMWGVYIAGIAVVASRTLYGIYRIWSIYNNGTKTEKTGYTLIESDKTHLPFSFFKWVFISSTFPLSGELDKVIKHEQLHVSQWHSFDILLAELLQVFFWFNPILILYKKALRQSHEYLADAYVTGDAEKYSYGQLLLGQSHSGLEIALANQFFNSQIKKRIKMMYKQRSSRPALVKYLAAVPVLAVLLLIFSSKVGLSENGLNSSDQQTIDKMENVISVYLSVDGSTMINSKKVSDESIEEELKKILPSFLGEETILLLSPEKGVNQNRVLEVISIGNNLGYTVKVDNYPKWKDAKQETITAESNEAIDIPEGYQVKVKTEDRMLKEGIDYTISDGKISLSKNTNLKPDESVSVYFLDEGLEGEFVSTPKVVIEPASDEVLDTDPIIVVDGKEIDTNGKELDELIKPDDIATINVLKGKAATDKYGARGKDGVIEITLKETHSFIFTDEVFKVVEQMPRFPGCEDVADKMSKERDDCAKQKMLEFIYTNLKYPAEARNNDIEGMVVVQFVVQKDGSTGDIKIVRAIGGGCDEEVERVVSTFPTWVPGEQRGKKVKVLYTLPVRYKLEGEKKEVKKEEELKKSENTIDKVTVVGFKPEPKITGDVLKEVDQMPRFPGCEDIVDPEEREQCSKQKMLTHIYTNVKYPKEAQEKGKQGMTVITFVVTKEGKLTKAKILRDIGGGCGEESLRVVKGMPDFIPGKHQGKAVNVQYTIPIKYKLADESEEKKTDNKLALNSPIATPNPASGIVNINFDLEGDQQANIQLLSSDGSLLEVIKGVSGKVDRTVDVSKYNTNLVMINVTQGKQTYTEKVIIQK